MCKSKKKPQKRKGGGKRGSVGLSGQCLRHWSGKGQPELQCELQASLGYTAKSCLKISNNNNKGKQKERRKEGREGGTAGKKKKRLAGKEEEKMPRGLWINSWVHGKLPW